MAETVDPREALGSNDVAVRTQAARDLAADGSFADLPVLVETAKSDKSPSVRLYAAAAAADVAMKRPLRPAERRAILELFRTWDPGHNPSLLMVLAAVPDQDGLERLGRLARDPRSDVRSGAITALRRMNTLPGADKLLAESVRRWLDAGKHPGDAVAELVRLAGEAGWSGMEDVIRRAAGKGRAAAIAAEQALEWLLARRDPTSWTGTWVAWSEDGKEVVDWVYLEGAHVWGRKGEHGPLTVADGVGTVEGLPPLRRIWVPRGGDEGTAEALKTEAHTYWRQAGKALAAVIEALDGALAEVPVAALGMARELAPLEGVSAMRARAIALWRGGLLREAEKVVESLAAGERKPNPHLQWIAGNVKLGLGDLDSARDALRIAVKGAPKKAAWKPEAEALLASLRG